MIYYCIYDNTGQIFRTGSCSIDQLPFQFIEKNNKIKVIDSSVNWDTHYVLNEEIQKLPIKPNQYSIFNYTTKQWEADLNKLINIITKQRNSLLLSSDWTQLPNNPLSQEQQTAWATYRKQLRDITSQPGYPTNVVWPVQPE
jgi:hypothetical protein